MAGSKGKKAALVAMDSVTSNAGTPAATTPSAPAPSTGTSPMVGSVKPPPAVKVPKAPAGFIPPSAADYRGFRPKRAELAVVPDAVLELRSFSDYAHVFGMTAPRADLVAVALESASKWSALLAGSTSWMDFVKAGEGMAWKDTLTLTDRLKAPFALASANDPSMIARYPAIARLLGAAQQIAKKAVATKKRNAAKAQAPAAGAVPQAPVAPAAAPAVQAPGVTTVTVSQ